MLLKMTSRLLIKSNIDRNLIDIVVCGILVPDFC